MGHSEGEKPGVVICCRGCRYELTGLPPGLCPECGRGFDPADPSTVWDIKARQRAVRRRRIRLGLMVVAIFGLAQLTMLTVIPRPAVGLNGAVQWGMWVWLGRGYGVQREELTTETLLVHRWGSKVSRIDSDERWSIGAPHRRWTLGRTGPDRWRLDVVDPTVEWNALLLAFNTMRTDDELFGVRIESSANHEAGHPFTIDGTRAQVLAELIRVYGLTIEPGLTSPDDTDVWVVMPGTGEFAEIPAEKAVELGFQVAPFRAAAVDRIEVSTGPGIIEGAADMLRAWREELEPAGAGNR